ncbi:hypothetical protein T07_9157 [Trichinella nelsoni]|uniref:Uncharacterized protein n=1 Tax=Trichinella nelsoni TaxID=6336 RepID=A0A0V0SGY1_9BILA|nr:hypothetical protein T07_9157 [Trichinella nelsoni]
MHGQIASQGDLVANCPQQATVVMKMSRKKNRPVFAVCTLNLATFLETRPLKATIHAVSSKLKQKCRRPKHIALVATTRHLETSQKHNDDAKNAASSSLPPPPQAAAATTTTTTTTQINDIQLTNILKEKRSFRLRLFLSR